MLTYIFEINLFSKVPIPSISQDTVTTLPTNSVPAGMLG